MEMSLERLSSFVSARRKEGKKAYPASVWQAVVRLRKQHSVKQIASATGINTALIYRQISPPKHRPLFREIKLEAPPPVASKSVVVELRRPDGAELRLRVEASREQLSDLFLDFLK